MTKEWNDKKESFEVLDGRGLAGNFLSTILEKAEKIRHFSHTQGESASSTAFLIRYPARCRIVSPSSLSTVMSAVHGYE